MPWFWAKYKFFFIRVNKERCGELCFKSQFASCSFYFFTNLSRRIDFFKAIKKKPRSTICLYLITWITSERLEFVLKTLWSLGLASQEVKMSRAHKEIRWSRLPAKSRICRPRWFCYNAHKVKWTQDWNMKILSHWRQSFTHSWCYFRIEFRLHGVKQTAGKAVNFSICM